MVQRYDATRADRCGMDISSTGQFVPYADYAALEAEYNEQCRLHQIGMERETRLIAERDAAERDLRKLKLKVISYGHRLAAAQAAAERQANK